MLRTIQRSCFKSRYCFSNYASNDLYLEWEAPHEGLNPDLNWSLCGKGVVPYGKAHHNSKLDLLKKYFKEDKYDGQVCKVQSEKDTSEMVKEKMSNGDRLFVMDGAVGGFEKDRSNVRVITNNADIGYLAKTLLIKVPVKSMDEHKPITVFALDSDEKDCYFHEYENGVDIFIQGRVHPQVFTTAIRMAASKVSPRPTSIILDCHIRHHNNHHSLIFNDNQAKDAVASNGAIWSNDGITNLFGGTILPKPKKAGTFLDQYTPTTNPPLHNLLTHPKFAIVHGSSSKSLTISEFLQATNAPPSLTDLLQSNNTKLHMVQKSSEIDFLLNESTLNA